MVSCVVDGATHTAHSVPAMEVGGEGSTSNPVKSSSSPLNVLTSANLVPCPHQPPTAQAMNKGQFAAFCSFLLPWLGPLDYRDGVTPLPPLNPGRPPERAGESTRTPLIAQRSTRCPAPRGGFCLPHFSPSPFEGPGGSGDHTRAPAPLRQRQSGPLPLHVFFLKRRPF